MANIYKKQLQIVQKYILKQFCTMQKVSDNTKKVIVELEN